MATWANQFLRREDLPCPPLYGTQRSPERETLGPRMGQIARLLGKPLMPHQQFMADVALELDVETGLPAYNEIVIIGPRQVTGKTEFILPMMTHRCIGFYGMAGPQRVMYTAQTADAAKEKWRDVHLPRLLQSPTIASRFRPRKTANQEAFLWSNGSIWAPGSTTGKSSGTGDTLDMGVIDEAWSRPDARTELGMRPAMLTRPYKQFLILSMIPGLSRAEPGSWPYLHHKRQVGRARVDADQRHGMAFFDFTAADGLDPGDPNTWWSCMPGLGRTVGVGAVAGDFDALDLVDFEAEYLGWEPSRKKVARWTLISKDLWSARYDPGSFVDGRPALAVEISEDRMRGYIGSAGRRMDGHKHIELIEPGARVSPIQANANWVEARLLEMIEDHKPVTVVIDPRRPANALVPTLRRRGIDVTTPNQQEIAGACGRFLDNCGVPEVTLEDGTKALSGDLLFHIGQPEVDDALAHARRVDVTGGGFTIVGKGVDADLGALYSLILAMHGHDVKGFSEMPDADIFF